MNKKVVLVVICVLLVLLVIGGCIIIKTIGKGKGTGNISGQSGDINFEKNVVVGEDGVKTNINENINKEVITVDEFELSNISLSYANGMSNFSAKIKNNSKKDYLSGLQMNVFLYAADGSLIAKLPVLTNSLVAGGEGNISSRTTQDCTSANDISFTIENK